MQTNIIYLKNRKFYWGSEKANALGIVFYTNRRRLSNENIEQNMEYFKTILKSWQHRKMTLLGKITVLKIFALPKLLYPLSVLDTPSQETIKTISDIMFNFVWDYKKR